MAIDPYAACPGGTGKKIKFCCPDLMPEIEKISRLLEADQRVACLEHIEKLEAKYPDRACLLSYRMMLQGQLGMTDKAAAARQRLAEKYPDNPIALAELAITTLEKEGPRAAVEALERGLLACTDSLPQRLYEAIQLLSQAFLEEGNILAARGHLMLLAVIEGTHQQQVMQLLTAMDRSPELSPLVKEGLSPVNCPDDAPYKRGFDQARDLMNRGAWIAASDKFYELAAKAGDWSPIWHNIATLRSWIGDLPGTVRALRKLAQQKITPDEALQAEALAQLLDVSDEDLLEIVNVTFEIANPDALAESLSDCKQLVRVPIDLSHLATEDQPPPKGFFLLLDRSTPAVSDSLTLAELPQSLGQVLWFGKQTDRAARLDLHLVRDAQLPRAIETLQRLLPGLLGQPSEPIATMPIAARQHMLATNLYFPPELPPAQLRELQKAGRRRQLIDAWPNWPQRALGGKSAVDAARDPQLQLKVRAALLILESAGDPDWQAEDFAQIRQQLNLPGHDPLSVENISVAELPLIWFSRIDLAKLTDEQLATVYTRANHFYLTQQLTRIVQEMLTRPSLEAKIDKGMLYLQLAELAPTSAESKRWFDQARDVVTAQGKSTANVDLVEFSFFLNRRDGVEAERLMRHIESDHINEPGVSQALVRILYEAGVIRPDGELRSAGREAPGAMPTAAPAESSGLWTPESAAGPPAGGKKSAIWTPDS